MMAGEGGKICRICRYADGVSTVCFRKKHERADARCRLHGAASRGDVPPARAKAKVRPTPEPPLEGRGEERRQPREMGGEAEAAHHGQVTLFVTRKRLHMQYPPDPLDKWISRSIRCQPGGDYVDEATGKARRDAEREEYQQSRERFHKRCKLGGKADRLVRIVPALTEHGKQSLRHEVPQQGREDAAKGSGDPKKDPGKETKATGGSHYTAEGRTTRRDQTYQPGGERGAERGAAQPGHYRNPRNQWAQQRGGRERTSSEPLAVGSGWKTVGHRPKPRNIGRKTRRADGEPSAHVGWTSCAAVFRDPDAIHSINTGGGWAGQAPAGHGGDPYAQQKERQKERERERERGGLRCRPTAGATTPHTKAALGGCPRLFLKQVRD